MDIILDFDPAGLVATGLDVDDDLLLLSLLSVAHLPTHVPRTRQGKPHRLIGVTLVSGNAPMRHVSANANHLIRDILGIGEDLLPVLDGARWRPPMWPWREPRQSTPASRWLARKLSSLPPRTVSILATGPLSNIAAALSEAPSMMKSVDRIVIMGGDLSPSHLDLNFKMDQQAVELVIQAAHRAGTSVELVTVQLCMQTAFTDADVTYLEELCSCNDDDDDDDDDNNSNSSSSSSSSSNSSSSNKSNKMLAPSDTTMPDLKIEGPLSETRPIEERFMGKSSKEPFAACLLTSRMHKQAMIMPRLINSALSSPPHLGFAAPSPSLRKGFIPWDLVALSRFLDKPGGDRGQSKESMLAGKTAEESSRDHEDGAAMYLGNLSVRNGRMMWERADESTNMRLLAATIIDEARFKYEVMGLLCGATAPRVAARGAGQGLGAGLWMLGLLGELMVVVLCLVAGWALLRRGDSRPR